MLCSFVFDLKYKNWGDDNSIKIMAIPVREKYINFISMIYLGEPVIETFVMDINPIFTIKINVLGIYKKILEKYIENIKNKSKNSLIITTEKDFVRLPDFHQKQMIDVLPVRIVFDDPQAILHFIATKIPAAVT